MSDKSAAVARPWNSDPLYMRSYAYQRNDFGVGEGALLVSYNMHMPAEPLTVTVAGPKAAETAKLYAVAPDLYEVCEQMRIALELLQQYGKPRDTRGFEADNRAGWERGVLTAKTAVEQHDEVSRRLHVEPGEVGSFNFFAVLFKNFSYLLARSKSAAEQCGNVIYNGNQQRAPGYDHETHMRNWRGVKDFIDQGIKNVEPSWQPRDLT